MRAAILAAVVVACTAACGETTPPLSSGSDAGSSSNDDDPSKTSSADAGTEGKPTGNRAPTGCLLETTGFLLGTKAENVARSDAPNAVAWTDVANALEADGAFASITLADGQESAKLRVGGFGFAVPATAETWGIEVELKRRAPEGGIEDQQVNVEIEGKPSSFKWVEGSWPTSIVGTHPYGQAVDTWGVDLFPADVNKPTFATTLTIKRSAGSTGSVNAVVDSLKVAIHYCPEPVKK